MKKIITYISILYIQSAHAVTINDAFPDNQGIPEKNIWDLINSGINAALGIAATIAVLFLIIGGVQYASAAGNEESIKKAKNTILYAIMGLIIIILALAFTNFIVDAF
jgi:uncharacterized membrane protein YwzB